MFSGWKVWSVPVVLLLTQIHVVAPENGINKGRPTITFTICFN